jgi:hypothetical protein
MFEIKTPYSKLHRAVRRIKAGFASVPGIWGYIDNNDVLNNIATNLTATTAQARVLKPVLGNASASIYEGHDVRGVGSVSTVEGIFRATVDGAGYQKVDSDNTNINLTTVYTQGADLSVAYLTTAIATSDLDFSLLADLGKLKPAQVGDTVVARVESLNATKGELTYETVTPFTKA